MKPKMKTKIEIMEPDCVVVKQTVEEVTESGIILTTESVAGGSMEKFEGTVLAIGDEVMSVKVGDYVSFGRNSFSIKRWNDEEYFYIRLSGIHTLEVEVDIEAEKNLKISELKRQIDELERDGIKCEKHEFFV